MIIDPVLVPVWLTLAAAVIMCAAVALAAFRAPWRALISVPERQHLLFGGLFAVLMLWWLSIEVAEGAWFHLLGITTLTLMVGWRFALLGGAVVTAAHVLLLGLSLTAVPIAWFFSVALSATGSRLLVHLLRRHGLRNPYVFLLGAGFGGGIASVLLIALATVPFLWLIDQEAWLARAVENAPLLVLIAFPEGFINGMLITAFTVMSPHLVKTFDDDYYLGD
ncbi:MAG: energy-coupling factor ABC transporter permease [Thioalkalivibrio sp.]|nr:energy-coupling factor ABC transporter permease [Thioalkalivibrio sp.]